MISVRANSAHKPRIHHVLIWLMESPFPSTSIRALSADGKQIAPANGGGNRLCLSIVATRDSNLHSQPSRQSIYALPMQQSYRCGLALARCATADRLS